MLTLDNSYCDLTLDISHFQSDWQLILWHDTWQLTVGNLTIDYSFCDNLNADRSCCDSLTLEFFLAVATRWLTTDTMTIWLLTDHIKVTDCWQLMTWQLDYWEMAMISHLRRFDVWLFMPWQADQITHDNLTAEVLLWQFDCWQLIPWLLDYWHSCNNLTVGNDNTIAWPLTNHPVTTWLMTTQ